MHLIQYWILIVQTETQLLYIYMYTYTHLCVCMRVCVCVCVCVLFFFGFYPCLLFVRDLKKGVFVRLSKWQFNPGYDL